MPYAIEFPPETPLEVVTPTTGDARYLKLDQTTPQTVSGLADGFLKLTSGVLGTGTVDLSTCWLTSSDQTLLTGDKSGSFDLTTTGIGTFLNIVETTPTLLKLDQTTPQTVGDIEDRASHIYTSAISTDAINFPVYHDSSEWWNAVQLAPYYVAGDNPTAGMKLRGHDRNAGSMRDYLKFTPDVSYLTIAPESGITVLLTVDTVTANTWAIPKISSTETILTNGNSVPSSFKFFNARTSVTATSSLGYLDWSIKDTSTVTNTVPARIEVKATQTVTTDINPVDMIFYTTPDTVASSRVEALRLTKNQDVLIKDNKKLLLGTGSDASILYDGTNLVINPKVVGSGYLQVSGQILATDKVLFTQTDGNEYIDSLADGYLDLCATTGIRFNNSTADTDVVTTWVGTTNSGVLTWMEDEDYFYSADKWLFQDRIAFTQTDGNEYIDSLADGYMDYRATTAHRFGDGTNQAIIKADGEINLEGTARVKRDLWISADGFKVPGTKPAASIDYGIGDAWEFTDGTDDTLFARFKLPNDMDKSVGATFYIGWSTPTADAGNCRWQIEYLYRQADEAMDAAADATLVDNFAASSTAKGLVISEIGTTAVPHADDLCVTLRIKRRADEAGDTLEEDNQLFGICMEYVSNRLGTAT